tara:strand:- start:148 stop:1074 length:927 start_codon:yes stop_codon:yes gene_type:complete
VANIAVLMATYNGENYVESQIQSILQSTINNKIYISDDASTDSTLKKIQNFKNKNIEIICKSKKGSSSKNFFSLIKNFPECEIESFEYFAFSDQDDLITKTHYENSIKLLKEKKAELCGSSTINIDIHGATINEINYDLTSTVHSHLVEGLAPGFTFVFTKKIFTLFREKLLENDIPEVFWHDWLLYSFCIESGHKVLSKKTGDVFYRQHDENLTGSRKSTQGFFQRLTKIFDNFYLEQIIKVSIALKLLTGKKNLVYRILHNESNLIEKLDFLFKSRRRIQDRFAISYVLLNLMLNAKKLKLTFIGE